MSSVLDDDLAAPGELLAVNDRDFSEAAFRKLQRTVNDDDPQPQVPPYYMWTERQQTLHKQMISRVATQIEKRIVVPDDKTLHEQLRKVEAAHAPEQGYASITILDVRNPDPDYATKMLKLGDKAPRRIGGSLDHTHQKETTRILEARYANGLDMRRAIPDAILQTERFADCCVPVDCERAIQSLNTYEQALRFSAKLLADARKKGHVAATLASYLMTLRVECTTPVFCIRFLHDATLEVCTHMEANSSYFALFAFDFSDHVNFNAKRDAMLYERALCLVRSRISAEVAAERAKAEKRQETTTRLLDAPLESLSNEQIAERTAMLRDERDFRSLVDKFHVRFEEEAKDKPADSEERRIAQFETLGVFAIDKSETLRTLPCKYRYLYFATCQCLTDEETDTPSKSATATTTAKAVPGMSAMIDGMSMTSSIGFNLSSPAPTKR